jgi:hypothetical protein
MVLPFLVNSLFGLGIGVVLPLRGLEKAFCTLCISTGRLQPLWFASLRVAHGLFQKMFLSSQALCFSHCLHMFCTVLLFLLPLHTLLIDFCLAFICNCAGVRGFAGSAVAGNKPVTPSQQHTAATSKRSNIILPPRIL